MLFFEGLRFGAETGGALDRTAVVLQRTGTLGRIGGAIERSRHVLPLEPAAAHTAGPLSFGVAMSMQFGE